MLSLNQLALRRGQKLLFEEASLQAHTGQRLGLVGANGSGKSSLLSMLLGNLEPDAGQFGFPPDWTLAHVRQEIPRGEGTALDYVMDGDTELRTLQRAIDAAQGDHADHRLYERLEAIDGYRAEARAARLLHGLGFSPQASDQAVETFSGGWRMRLNLAQALMCRSDLLLLDEPTNHLDLPAILWLEKQLAQFEGVLIVISHDRDFLDGVCTRIAHIEQERMTLYTGHYSDFEAQRAARLAQREALYMRQQKEIAHLQGFVDRFRYKASKAKQAQSRLKMMERMTRIVPAHVDSPFRFRFLEPEKNPQHLLKLQQARLGYRDDTVLQSVTLNLTAGDRLGLLGVNGAGKSTLVKALARGSTLLGGERIVGRDTRIGYFAQHQLDLLEADQSVIDHLRTIDKDGKESELRDYLGRFGFHGDRVFETVAPFSGGEKARLVLALMIRQKPNLLLLDEPTNHLDLEMRQALSMALMEFTGALVVISHDRHLLRSVCDELMIVHSGRVEVFPGSLDDYAAWLRSQESISDISEGPRQSGAIKTRKQQRQAQAQRRQLLKPLLDQVRQIEKSMERDRKSLVDVEEKLADESLYSDPARASEITELTQLRSTLRARIDRAEWDWLSASEALENAESG